MFTICEKDEVTMRAKKESQSATNTCCGTSTSKGNYLTIRDMVEKGHLSGRTGKEFVIKIK